jgi:ABC-type branched-subunit amino acid transport system substrate-binding protein
VHLLLLSLLLLLSNSGSALVSAAPYPNKTRTVTLGFLGSTNLRTSSGAINSNTLAGGAPALFAVRLAVETLNAQSTILPHTHLKLVSNNTNSDAGTANFQAFEQIQRHQVATIIGEYNSGVSAVVAYPSRFYQVPQISYGSTSPDFTTFHESMYPYFLRMCPSQVPESALLASLIYSLGWRRVGILYTTDTAGVSGAQAFSDSATALGIEIVVPVAFLIGAPISDVYYALQIIAASEATILLFIGAITDMQRSDTHALAYTTDRAGHVSLGLRGLPF